MAYDKKYIENGDLVKGYLDDREDRIEGAFEGVDDEISQVNVKIDNKFEDMIDYPIEQQLGVNQYTKWKSGRLQQYVNYTSNVTSGNNEIIVPMPVNYVSSSYITANLRTMSISYSRLILHRVIQVGNHSVKVSISSEANTDVDVMIFFEGRWK